MDVDSQPTMEETILVGDDLMMGPPSPIIPPEIASHVLLMCLKVLICLKVYFYDRELRKRLQDSEQKLGLSMPLNDAKERASQLETEVTSLDRYVLKWLQVMEVAIKYLKHFT
ncbi:hypothetical protein RchiOBHm_Chr5g0054771 [Rosa chinensis]|uniref:DUF7803 domain-containing protein n=1 Tax=Rosa chinensis TaxID=74649 RepID=A0A2P6QG86_ROSCH|nr:hypothetical protein RchiOBHm_Chr5g0054771 [Rosa chinensis]